MKGLQKVLPRAGIGVGLGGLTVGGDKGTFWGYTNIVHLYCGGDYLEIYTY